MTDVRNIREMYDNENIAKIVESLETIVNAQKCICSTVDRKLNMDIMRNLNIASLIEIGKRIIKNNDNAEADFKERLRFITRLGNLDIY